MLLVEADQIHVREVLKDLEVEQTNDVAAPFNRDKKSENNARSGGSKGKNQFEPGQRQTKHDWDDGVPVTTRTECR